MLQIKVVIVPRLMLLKAEVLAIHYLDNLFDNFQIVMLRVSSMSF